MTTKSLDVGCGSNPRNPFNADELHGLDVFDHQLPNFKVCDLILDKLPYEDNTFDYITFFDVLEHIPRLIYIGRERKTPFIDLMNEAHRVLKPGGTFYSHTPAFPHSDAFRDPTHVNFISDLTVYYFTEWLDLAHTYGFYGNFELVNQQWRDDSRSHLVWELKAVK